MYNAEYEAKNLVDGDVATEWANMQAMGRYDWVDIDLGEPFDIGRVEVVTRQTIDNDLTRKFLQIQVSNKSTFENYTIVGSQDFEPIPFAGTWSRPFRSTEKYRYVRMLVSKQGTHKALAEIRVLSADTPKLTSVAPIIVTNLLINPGIEELTSAGPWASTGPRTTVFRTSKEFYAGTASAKVVRTPTAWYGYVGQNGLNLAPGQTYRFSAWVKRESGEVDMVINISQNGKKLDGKDTVTVATAKVGTQWTKLEGTLTLPAQGDAKFGGVYDNATVYVGVTAEDGTATSIPAFFFDEVSVSLEK